jgi:para-nitrobenzyl esterase
MHTYHRGQRAALLATCLAVLAPPLIAVPSATASPAPVTGSVAPHVRVAQGALAGTVDKGARAFLGIRYAQPPVGELRWRAPLPPKAWRGTRAATRFGPGCMQPPPDPFGAWTAEFMAGPDMSEDCLTLNVWAPAGQATGDSAKVPAATARAPLPVLVWIHGGAFMGGSGAIPIYNGASLAQRGAVVVTINYRLGIFGYMAHPALSAESPRHVSGNYGLLDAIAALRWLQSNIALFGGDPKQVTIAGQSAGAATVNDLIVSPDAKGLFARAIAESGSGMGIVMQSLADAERQGERIQQAAGAASLAALRALPAASLQALKLPPPPGTPGDNLRLPFGPVLDGVVQPVNAQRGDVAVASAVPLLTGYNADEDRSMFAAPVGAQAFEAKVRARYGASAERLLALYPHADDAQADDADRLLARDRYMVSLALWSLARTAASGQPIHAYLFDHVLPGPDATKFRSFHTAEVPYVFGVLQAPGRSFDRQDHVVSQVLQRYWLDFMRTGDPNGGAGASHSAVGSALPQWPRFEADLGKVLRLDESPAPVYPASSSERYQALRDYVAAGGLLSMF